MSLLDFFGCGMGLALAPEHDDAPKVSRMPLGLGFSGEDASSTVPTVGSDSLFSEQEQLRVLTTRLTRERDDMMAQLDVATRQLRKLKKENALAALEISKLRKANNGIKATLEGKTEDKDMLDRVFDW